MAFYKNEQNGYVLSIAKGSLGMTEISETEYNTILLAIRNAPTETEEIGYKLKTDLTWEQYEKEPEPDDPSAEDKAEAYDILMGVKE